MNKRSFWDRIFPVKRDFYKMLSDQAKATAAGVATLYDWLSNRTQENHVQLFQLVAEADKIRFNMEDELIEAFATPFDRQDIYSLSIEMDRVLAFAESTLLEMEAYEAKADETILAMVDNLKNGTAELAEAITDLKVDPFESQVHIENIRKVQSKIDEEYRAGMRHLFQTADMLNMLKYREVYHHIKDASIHLGYTTDVVHRIVVRVI